MPLGEPREEKEGEGPTKIVEAKQRIGSGVTEKDKHTKTRTGRLVSLMTARSIPDGRVAAHFLCRKRKILPPRRFGNPSLFVSGRSGTVPSICACIVRRLFYFLHFYFISLGRLPVASNALQRRARTPSGERASRASRWSVFVCSAVVGGHRPEKDEWVVYRSAYAHLQQGLLLLLYIAITPAQPVARTESDTDSLGVTCCPFRQTEL